ncbi:AGE family epimerase/isomerase [Puteibacter caeruleilacunae]|nr:AGE family epimerase/isomerase [Puteibacter caeruleilacunae]
MKIQELKEQYKRELLDNVVPFWLENSLDKVNGGYYTCLDREGNVFDTDKFIWLQARQVWLFAKLYNEVERNPEWLECAIHGADFLMKYGNDGKHNWYFSLREDGEPLIQPYNIFSDCFAVMAFGQLSKATNNEKYSSLALKTFENIIKRKDNPKGAYNKVYPNTRPLKNFALPMILCNLALEIEHLLDANFVKEITGDLIGEVMDVFYRPELDLVVENVTPEGNLSDSFDGRLLNPGHAIEAMWFMMDLGERFNDKGLITKATEITLSTLNKGWDEKWGGIYYFLDRNGCPPQQLEWDQKLWWVHIETLISLLKGYYHTENIECLKWFEKVHEYTWKHFKDADFGEWYGYLNRRGEVLLPLKGGKWKGCFHVPRGLYQCWKTLERIENKMKC